MAVPSGTYQTYAAKGIREDLSDMIHDISPTERPFMSNVGKTKASATYTEWQTDELDAATAANQHIEGDDSAVDTATATKRFGNYLQIFKKTPQVAGTQRAVDTAGRRDEMNYQLAKRGRELLRDMEKRFTSKFAAAAGDASTAREAAGLGAWLFDNQVKLGSGTTTVSVTTVPTTDPTHTNETAITEAALKSAIQLAWTEGGDPSFILCGPQDKQVISGFSGIATQYTETGKTTSVIVAAADRYISDFGEHTIVPSRFSDSGAVYGLDLEYWEVSYLRNVTREDLAKTGDSDKAHIVAEATLCAKNPKSSFKVYATR